VTLRFAGAIEERGGKVTPIYVSVERHVCGVHCFRHAHVELLYRADTDPVSRDLAQTVVDIAIPGLQVLHVRRAHGVPLPAGYRAAWLVTYGRRR
jgi:hypothetical protein